jgi:tetratricopeptide (TPR) repeat protein
MQWADPTSLRLVAFLARRLESQPVCLAISARLDEADAQPVLGSVLTELEQEKRLLSVTLSPLSRADTISLTRVLMAPVATLGVARVGEHVWRMSDGNPLVVVEAVRTLRESAEGVVAGGAAAPERVRRIVVERLQRLDAPTGELCAAASVLGTAFSLDLLRQMTGVDEVQALDGVEDLVGRRILRLVDDELDFTHDRIREVAYAALPPVRRRLLHAQAGAAIEERHAADLEPQLGALARHWREAEAWDKAIHYRRIAADQAVTRAAYGEAGTLLAEALELVGRLAEPPIRDDGELDVRLRLRVLTKLVGEGEHLGEHLDEAERLARSLGDDRRLAFVLSEKSHVAWLRGDQTRAMEFGRQVLALGQKLGDPPVEGFGHRLLGKAYIGLGLCRPAAEHLSRAVELLPDDGQPDFGLGDALSGTRNWLAVALSILGEFDEAARILDMVIAASPNDHRQLAWATNFAGFVRIERGEVAEAMSLLERSRHLIATWQIAAVAPWTVQLLGRACAMAGRHAEALRLLDRFEPRPQLFGSRIALIKGEAYLAAEMLDDALAMAHTSLELARRLGERGAEGPALRLLGDVYARLGTAQEHLAETHYAQGLALSEEHGGRPEAARCHLGLGLLYRRAGRHDDARPHLQAAGTLLRAMGMSYWLARMPAGTGP